MQTLQWYLGWASINRWLLKASRRWPSPTFWIKTAPNPLWLASVLTVTKMFSLKWAITGAETRRLTRALLAASWAGPHDYDFLFLRNAWRWVARAPKSITKGRIKEARPRKPLSNYINYKIPDHLCFLLTRPNPMLFDSGSN